MDAMLKQMQATDNELKELKRQKGDGGGPLEGCEGGVATWAK